MIRTLVQGLFILFFSFALTACMFRGDDEAQGYVEGKLTYIAPNANGTLNQLQVARGALVKKGTLLFILDPQPESDTLKAASETLEQAKAQIAQTNAALTLAKVTLQRNQTLYRKGVIQKALLDAATSDYDQQFARLQQAKGQFAGAMAELNKANWSQTQKTVTAPVDGFVFDTYYQKGEVVSLNRPVLSLLAPTDIKAIFFVGEEQLSPLKMGGPVKFDCDGCKQRFVGKISFISPFAEYTPPVIYSEATRSKLVFRIEATLDNEGQAVLHPGQPLSVLIPRA